MAGRSTPAPRRVASPVDLLRVEKTNASMVLGMQSQLVIVDTSGGPVTLTLPSVASMPPGRTISVVQQGVNDLLLQPAATDDLGGGGAGVPLNVTSAATPSITVASDGVTGWLTQAIDADVGAIASALGGLVGATRRISVPALGAEAASVRSTEVQVLDGAGATAVDQLVFDVAVFDDAALAVPSVNGTAAVGAKGTPVSGGGTNAAVLQADNTGALSVDVTDLVGAASHWLVVTLSRPNGANSGFLLADADIQTAAWA